MRNFFKLVLANLLAIFLFGAGLLFIAIMFMVAAFYGGGPPKVQDASVLVLNFKNNIVESPADEHTEFLDFLSKVKDVALYDVLRAIKNAEKDSQIKGISIETDAVSAGITQLDEVRAALSDFKKSGKFVLAYGNTVSQSSYYLGSVADQYYLNPAGEIELKGLSSEVTFFKDFADKYGIGLQVIRHGKFKAAVEPFLRNEISPENREQLSTLLNDIWSNTSAKISASRKISADDFKTATDSLYGSIPSQCIRYRLADRLLQKSQYDELLKEKCGIKGSEKLHAISFSGYVSTLADPVGTNSQVALLFASGSIMNGEGSDGIHSDEMIKQIKKLEDDAAVKAVVFRINSPGGSANASDAILYELQQLKAKKPLVVSFGDYAASGGYYIAMAADKIYSEPNTVTGSIGVFGVVPNIKELANRNGVRSDVVQTNANSDMVSLINGVTPYGMNVMTKSVEQTYKRFVYFVSQNRKKSFEQIDEIGGGHVWSGVRGKEIGLVDDLGSLQDAIKFAAGKANLADYSVTSFPKKKNPLQEFFENTDDDLQTRIIKAKIGEANYKILQQLMAPKNTSVLQMAFPFTVTL